MRNFLALWVFLVSFFLSQVPMIAPWYARVFFLRGNFQVSRLDQYYDGNDGQIWRYRIPIDQMLKPGSHDFMLSLGVLRPSVKIRCGNTVETINLPNSPVDLDLDRYSECQKGVLAEIES